MLDEVVEDVTARVERNVTARMDELKELLSRVLSCCAKETCVREESDTVKVLLSGIEMRFRAEHGALVEAINAHTLATKVHSSHLEVLCKEVQAMNEKKDVLCSHTAHLGDIDRDLKTIADTVKGVVNQTEVVSTFVSILHERVGDIGVIIGQKADEIRKAEEARRVAELKEQEERRKAEEAARLKEEREQEERQQAEKALRVAFSRGELEISRWRILSTPSDNGWARRSTVEGARSRCLKALRHSKAGPARRVQ